MAGDVSNMATWSAPGEGERLWFVGTLATIRVPGEAVDGRFALIEFLFPRHASPPLHTHPQDESYERFVRDGAVPASRPTLPPADTPRPTSEEMDRIFGRHGQVNLGPPLGPED
jgi:hypothetical protein